MIVPLVTVAALMAGATIGWMVVRRPVPATVPWVDPQPAERAIWFRSARELYRTVQGVVADLDVGAAASAAGEGTEDPAARAWLTGAVTRARGAATWAIALRDQAIEPEAERTCDQVASGMAALADAAWAAIADPGDVDRARRVDAQRDRARRDAERLVRLL